MSKKSTDHPNAWVFISHSNKDFDKVRLIRNKLEERDYRPLLFYLKCLENQAELEDLIKREIDVRERFILCKSKNIEGSKWVKEEMKYIRSQGRPLEEIDLDKDDIDFFINRFDRRSTLYRFSTENEEDKATVVDESTKLLEAKAFKVEKLPFVLTSLPSHINMLERAYFLVIVSRQLKKEEAGRLNQLVERFQLNAVAYRFHGRGTAKPTSSSQSTMLEFMVDDPVDNHDNYDGWNDLNESMFRKVEHVEGVENSIIANAIVNDLMCWDKELYGIYNDDQKPIEQSKDKNDLLKRLQRYVKDYPTALVLPLAVNKTAHETYLKWGWDGTIMKKYFYFLDEPVFIALLNLHAGVKGKKFASVYSCTDLEILTLVLEDLVNNKSPQALAANAAQVYVQGVPVSSLRHYIEHLLSINGIRI